MEEKNGREKRDLKGKQRKGAKEQLMSYLNGF